MYMTRVQIRSKILYSNFLFIHHEATVGIWFNIVNTVIQFKICVASCLKCGAFCSAIQANLQPVYDLGKEEYVRYQGHNTLATAWLKSVHWSVLIDLKILLLNYGISLRGNEPLHVIEPRIKQSWTRSKYVGTKYSHCFNFIMNWSYYCRFITSCIPWLSQSNASDPLWPIHGRTLSAAWNLFSTRAKCNNADTGVHT